MSVPIVGSLSVALMGMDSTLHGGLHAEPHAQNNTLLCASSQCPLFVVITISTFYTRAVTCRFLLVVEPYSAIWAAGSLLDTRRPLCRWSMSLWTPMAHSQSNIWPILFVWKEYATTWLHITENVQIALHIWTTLQSCCRNTTSHCTTELLSTDLYDFRAPIPWHNRWRSSCFTKEAPAMTDTLCQHWRAVLSVSGCSRRFSVPWHQKKHLRVRALPQTKVLEAVVTGAGTDSFCQYHCTIR